MWAYLCGKKGATGEEWVAAAINDDLTTIGVNGEHLIPKSDQENAIGDVLTKNTQLRDDRSTARENSVLGDSNNNGKVDKQYKKLWVW